VDDLSEKVAINAAIYESTDRLLCHDDELEGRRIAFIVYMVEDWQEADAGHLDLFSVDKNG
jgi:Rps23 Pro-64 3,4-dihydroxylase Tpa1-like proline 4-hydroxylase